MTGVYDMTTDATPMIHMLAPSKILPPSSNESNECHSQDVGTYVPAHAGTWIGVGTCAGT